MNCKLENKLKQVFEVYPYLHRKVYPFKEYYPAFLEGYLVTKQECNECKISCESDATYYSFYARIFVPNDYESKGIEVYDLYKKIDTEFIINNYPEHFHFNKLNTNHGNLICTHLKGYEIDSDNIIFENINSAHYYFLNYINLKNGNSFNMKEYSHGRKGIKEFFEEKDKKNGKRK